MPKFNEINQAFVGSSQVTGLRRGANLIWAPYNSASGGTEATIPNYNGTGETWKTHTFTSNGTLTVTGSYGVYPLRVLLVGGGSGGTRTLGPGADPNHRTYGTGGDGGYVLDGNYTLPTGALTVTVGAGGGSRAYGAGHNGGETSLDTLLASSGTIKSNGGSANWWANGGPGGAGTTSDVSGTSVTYAGGGGGGGNPELKPGGAGANGGGGGGRGAYFDGDGNTDGGNAVANTGSGGGGAGGTGDRNVHNSPRNGGTGGSGVVIVAYRIA